MTEQKKPKIPAGVKKPQDHKQPARAAEADGSEFVTLSARGVDMLVPRSQQQWSLAALDAFAEGNQLRGLKLLVGVEQWQALLDAGAIAEDLTTLGQQFADQFGITQGN